MCKKTIEKAVNGVEGVASANWDVDKKKIDVSFDDAVFTVFDIETTGLSVNYDKIIEIAAVKIKNNHIIEEYQTVVTPICV